MENQSVLLNEAFDFEKAIVDDDQLQKRFNQISEINDVLINLFHKAYSVSQAILTSELSELEIKKHHHDFIEMLAMSQAVGDMMAKKKSVNEMIAFYLLGAKTQAKKILLEAEDEAERIVKAAHTNGPIEELLPQKDGGVTQTYEALMNKSSVVLKPKEGGQIRGQSKLMELKQELNVVIIQLGIQVDQAIESIESFKG